MKFFFIILLISFSAKAQSTAAIQSADITSIDSLVLQYQRFFQSNKTLLSQINSFQTTKDGLWNTLARQNISQKSLETKDTGNANNNGVNLAISDIGLKWVSDVSHNFKPGITDLEDMYFKSRLSTGVDWVLLGEGSWHRNKQEISLFQKQIQRDSLALQFKNVHEDIRVKLEVIEVVFDLHRLEVLEKYALLLEEQNAYFQSMYDKKLILYAELLKSKQKLDQVNNNIHLIHQYVSKYHGDSLILEYWMLPYAFADLPDRRQIEQQTLLKDKEELLRLRKDILLHQKSQADRPSLRAKFRYNYYDNQDQPSRSFASVGASLSIPIRLKNKDVMTQYEVNNLDFELQEEKRLLKQELISEHRSFYSLRNELEIVENELEYLLALLENESDVYSGMNKSFSPGKYIEYVQDFVVKKIEFLNIQQALCQQYVLFYSSLGYEDLIQGANLVNPEQQDLVQLSYLWKKGFDAISNTVLLKTLVDNNFSELLLSPGNENNNKVEEFLLAAKQKNIKVYRLIGENSFAQSDKGYKSLFAKMQQVKQQGFLGVHLNIEPHTFEDYKINRDLYVDRMNLIYRQVKKWCDQNQMELSVSIPMHLPLENALVLKDLGIPGYIMAYETINQDKLLNKTKALRDILDTQLSWVIRVSDFSSLSEIEKVKEVLLSHKINKIGYYDLTEVIKLIV